MLPPDKDPIAAARAEALHSAQVSARDTEVGERAGDRIDRYELIEPVGEGGMGTVWRARQSEPVVRDVALKVIKFGMDTKEVVVRFEAERQALALMDHPGIASVLDAGATHRGRPFFVMELVDGVPITRHCDSETLDLPDRLSLFVRVCEAVQHAHHKGVIHRDIKPSNVLVSMRSGSAEPKVIDFGIAKATSAELTQKTFFTRHAQIVGTPEYMAPEQAALSGVDVDTRADVYSLGALLYELLTGTKPFEVDTVMERGYLELLRTIREVEPAKPSTRISSVGVDTPEIALHRGIEVRSLQRSLRGDLDWIVMKALEKERARRYDTPGALADDIVRYLANEPVVAAPPNSTYRIRKFVSRRKQTVAAAAIVLLALLIGSVGMGVGWVKSQRANASLDLALSAKEDARAEEQRQRERAEESAARALEAQAESSRRAADLSQVAQFQADRLRAIDVSSMGLGLRADLLERASALGVPEFEHQLAGINFTDVARTALERSIFAQTVDAINDEFAQQPPVRAGLLYAIAGVMLELGMPEKSLDPAQLSVEIRQSALGPDHPDTLKSLNHLGRVQEARGNFATAEKVLRAAMQGCIENLGEDALETLDSINNLAMLMQKQGRFEEALELQTRACEGFERVAPGEYNTHVSQTNLGLLLADLGQRDDSRAQFTKAIRGLRDLVGTDHPATLSAISNLGLALWSWGDLESASAYTIEALEARRRLLGDESPDTLISIANLGSIRDNQNRLGEAEALYREALAGFRRAFGDEHPRTLNALNNLATLLAKRGRNNEAIGYQVQVADGMRSGLGAHPNTFNAIYFLGVLQARLNRAQAAEASYREAIAGFRGLNPNHSRIARINEHLEYLLKSGAEGAESGTLPRSQALLALGSHYVDRSEFAAAESALVEALSSPELSDQLRMEIQVQLGVSLAGLGQHASAETLLTESAEWFLQNLPGGGDARPPATRSAVGRLVELLRSWPGGAREAEAEAWAAR